VVNEARNPGYGVAFGDRFIQDGLKLFRFLHGRLTE